MFNMCSYHYELDRKLFPGTFCGFKACRAGDLLPGPKVRERFLKAMAKSKVQADDCAFQVFTMFYHIRHVIPMLWIAFSKTWTEPENGNLSKHPIVKN